MNDDLVQRLMELSEPRQDKCDGCPWEEEYPDCTGCICKTTKEAAKAILEMQGIIKKQRDLIMAFGGETGIRRLKEYADKYWALLEKHRWIPVTERLPEHGWYLAYCPTIKMEVLHFHSAEEVWSSERYYNIEVTHWMPLPEPPKEE